MSYRWGIEGSSEPKTVWGRGDYHRFAKETIWGLGPMLVEACGIGPGQRVLDVAAGSGNTAIRAAQAGADVVASDLEPTGLAAGRREAEALGAELEWREADAEALPFGDAEFDAVLSSLGVMFAPDHAAAAGELIRVCRPGGTIGLLNFTPEGLIGDFFGALAPYAPEPPPGAQPPPLWGSEDHVRELIGDSVEVLDMTRDSYVERAPDPAAYRDLLKRTFGPIVAMYDDLAGEPERLDALDRDLLDFAARANEGDPGGPAEYRYEFLLVVARVR